MARMRDASQKKDPLAGLTGQERRILELIGEGLTNRQIGGRVPGREDREELRVRAVPEARHGAPHPGRRLRRAHLR